MDEHGVQADVERARQHVEQRRRAHVSAALEHARAEARDGDGDERERADEEIPGGVLVERGVAAQPDGEGAGDGDAGRREDEAEYADRHHGLAEDVARLHVAAGADELGDLHGEARAGAHGEAVEHPEGRLDESDRCGGMRAEAAHHRGVDVLHEGGRELRQDGGGGERQHDERHPAAAGRLPLAEGIDIERVRGHRSDLMRPSSRTWRPRSGGVPSRRRRAW